MRNPSNIEGVVTSRPAGLNAFQRLDCCKNVRKSQEAPFTVNASETSSANVLFRSRAGKNAAKPSSPTIYESRLRLGNTLRAKASARTLAIESKIRDVAIMLNHYTFQWP
jgi:hypothetical protein